MPNIHWNLDGPGPSSSRHRAPSFNALALDLASDLGDNRYGPDPLSPGGGLPLGSSFSDQFLREQHFVREMERRREEERRRSEEQEQGMVGRIMLARMNTLEEGFREVLREVKDLVVQNNSSRGGSEIGGFGARPSHVKNGSSGSQLGLLKSVASSSKVAKLAEGKIPSKKNTEKPSQPPGTTTKKGKERLREQTGSSDGFERVVAGSRNGLGLELDPGEGDQYDDDVSPGTTTVTTTTPRATTIAELGIPVGKAEGGGGERNGGLIGREDGARKSL